MANIFDYLDWRGDLEFSQSPLNPVDYMIFSQLSYLPFDGIVPGPGENDSINIDLALKKLAEKKVKTFLFKEDPEFIKKIVMSKRFMDCHLLGFVNNIDPSRELQFSALCVYTNDGCCVGVFRGTDDHFVGWKEDLNMGFKEVIPSQTEAVKYVDTMIPLLKSNVSVCGHSKGGNLAIYSSSFCDSKNRERIKDIYSFDAPGFHKNVTEKEGFTAIKNRIHSYVPQSSVVGMLLEPATEYNVIKSTQSGLYQHSLYTWEVTHNNLAHVDAVDLKSRFVDRTLKQWMDTLDNEQREKFIDAIYSLLTASNVNSFFDLENNWLHYTGKILKSYGSFDENTKKLIGTALSGLIRSAGKNISLLTNKKDELQRN